MAVMGLFWTPMALLQQTAAYVTHLRGSILWRQAPGSHRDFRLAVYLCQHCGRLLFLLLIPAAGTLFHLVGHSQAMRLEAEYFVALCYSGMPTALVAAASGFFHGLRQREIICASTWWGSSPTRFSTMLIFGKFGFPAIGVAGAGYATALGTWASAFMGCTRHCFRKNTRASTGCVRAGGMTPI